MVDKKPVCLVCLLPIDKKDLVVYNYAYFHRNCLEKLRTNVKMNLA
jgi:hypothetical protein